MTRPIFGQYVPTNYDPADYVLEEFERQTRIGLPPHESYLLRGLIEQIIQEAREQERRSVLRDLDEDDDE